VGRREHTRAANRAAILAAARELFSVGGYDAVSVRDIVRRTDLASGTFYNYFPDKHSIFRALVEETASEGRGRVRAARRGGSGAEGFIEGGFGAYFEFIASDPRTFVFLRRNAGTIREHFGDAFLPAGLAELEEDLRAAIESGQLPPLDLAYCARAMLAVALEVGEELLSRDPPDIQGATRFVGALFSGGLERLTASLR
jgi:AcrR family transcriptional regulator